VWRKSSGKPDGPMHVPSLAVGTPGKQRVCQSNPNRNSAAPKRRPSSVLPRDREHRPSWVWYLYMDSQLKFVDSAHRRERSPTGICLKRGRRK
jgi:arylsulfatase A-like enzyme